MQVSLRAHLLQLTRAAPASAAACIITPSHCSWDLFGTYPDSMNYRDRSIVRSISNHNMKVVVALTLQQSGPEAAAKMQAFLEQQEKEYGSVDQ